MFGDSIADYLAAKKTKLKFSFVGNKIKFKNIKNFRNLHSAVNFYFKKSKKYKI